MTDIEQRLAAAGLRVKPLEWKDPSNDGFLVADSIETQYEAYPEGNLFAAAANCCALNEFCGTIEDAKFICNVHNAAAILSSLEVIE